MRYASRVAGLAGAEAAAWDIHHLALERRARGEDIILLSELDQLAQPTFRDGDLDSPDGRRKYDLHRRKILDQLDLPEDRRASLLSEGARAALLESFPVG